MLVTDGVPVNRRLGVFHMKNFHHTKRQNPDVLLVSVQLDPQVILIDTYDLVTALSSRQMNLF